MAVYLIHFSRPLSHARHYIGFAETDVEARLERHLAGRGAKLTRAAVDAGIELKIAVVWPHGDRSFERSLKNQKNTPKLCPFCNGQLEHVDEVPA